MISTYSKFYYGFEVTENNRYIDFNEGGSDLVATVAIGSYTISEIATAAQTALNDAGAFTYTCTVNLSTRVFTITSSNSAADLLFGTGTNASKSIASTIGFAASNVTNFSTTSGSAAGSVYSPQFKLQDYVDQQDSRSLRDATVNKSASGLVEVQSFGTDRMFEFSIKFATDITQSSSGPIINNKSGVANLRSFMQFLITKAPVLFFPDKDTVTTSYKIILESSGSSSSGTGYKINDSKIAGYFETGVLTFRIIED